MYILHCVHHREFRFLLPYVPPSSPSLFHSRQGLIPLRKLIKQNSLGSFVLDEVSNSFFKQR